MTLKRALIFFCLALLVALAAQVPAHWLGARIAAATEGRVQFEDARGTLWRGQANIRIAGGVLLDDIEWRFQPLGLLRLEWRYQLQSDHPSLRGSTLAGATLTGFRLSETDLRLPARNVGVFFPLAGTFSPEGLVQLQTPEISCSRALACDGDAIVQWSEAALALAELRPLGDYQLALQARAGKLSYDVKTLKGSLRLAGKGEWQPGSVPRFTGELSAAPADLPRVQGLMRLFGEPDPRGMLRIQR
jgi:general secretion pathway protein N